MQVWSVGTEAKKETADKREERKWREGVYSGNLKYIIKKKKKKSSVGGQGHNTASPLRGGGGCSDTV